MAKGMVGQIRDTQCIYNLRQCKVWHVVDDAIIEVQLYDERDDCYTKVIRIFRRQFVRDSGH